MAQQITFSYFAHEAQSFRRQLLKFKPISMFTFNVTDDRNERVLVFLLKWKKIEFRVLIKHCFLMGKNDLQTKQWLDKCYKKSSPSRKMVEKWIGEFKRGRMSTNDAEGLGRP